MEKTWKMHNRTEKCAGNEREGGLMATALSQVPLSCSLCSRHVSLPADPQPLTPGSCCLDTFANGSSSARFAVPHGPSLYLVAPSHPTDPSSNTASSGEALVTSRYGRSLALWLCSTDCNIRLYIRWLIHICIHSYLTNMRAGATVISLPTIPPVLPAEPSKNRCSRNAHIAWVMNTWQKPDEVLVKLEMTVYEYWPSSWTHMKTITSNYLAPLGKSWADVRIDHMY